MPFPLVTEKIRHRQTTKGNKRQRSIMGTAMTLPSPEGAERHHHTSDVSPPPSSSSPRLRPVFVIKIIFYVSTGIIQPMLVDALRLRSCLGRKSLLLPTLARTTGMALVGILSTSADRSNVRRMLTTDADFRKSLLFVACVDLLSGMLLTGGILLTGGAIFVVLYNSCPAWTALLSKYFLGHTLTTKQSTGVAVVVLGLISNVFGTTEQLSSHGDGSSGKEVTTVTIGSGVVLLGCVLHSAFFVLSDRFLRGNKKGASKGVDCHGQSSNSNAAPLISPPLWSSCLGFMEATVMAIYVLTSVNIKGFQEAGVGSEACSPSDFVRGFCFMLLTDAIHSAAFFSMLKQIGAVGSALLKGIQSVAVVALSAIVFCPREETQCLTPLKAMSALLVLSGMIVYAVGSAEKNAKEMVQEQQKWENRSGDKSDLPSLEIESLLES